MTVKLLGFDGSGRKGSMNRKLLELVSDEAKALGAEVTLINLTDYDIPLYNGDLEAEQGLPKDIIALKKLFNEQDGFLIASPEYNGSFSPLLKNTIDWLTRPGADDSVPRQPLAGKLVGLMAAAPGQLKGLRGIYQLNTLLFGINATVLGEIVAIGHYGQNFDEQGQLKEEKDQAAVKKLANRIVKLAK